jgi:UDP-2,3-diacylglucosamine pyrophosphatase LpxH
MRPIKRLFKKEERVNKPKSSMILDADYFTFMKQYSTNERAIDKARHNKIKTTSTDRFEECIQAITERISEKGEKRKILVSGAVDGVDEVISAYANISSTCDAYAVFFDINTYKIEYFTFRLFLTQISETREEYLRNLFFYMKGDEDTNVPQIIEKAAKSPVTKEIHAEYLLQQAKSKIRGNVEQVRAIFRKGAEILSISREGETHHKLLAKELIQNMSLNPETHWLSDETLYKTVRNACMRNRIKSIQADLNRAGKAQLASIITEAGIVPKILYVPKGAKKFRGSYDLIKLFEICIDTIPPPNRTDKHREWNILDPDRFFSTPQFKHQGELSTTQLMALAEEYKQRTNVTKKVGGKCNIMLIGDVPFGRLYLDERSKRFLDAIVKYSNSYKVENIALCGDIIDGEHSREKRKLAFLQYLTDEPLPSIQQQCRMAKEFVSRFDGRVYTVASDGDWDMIEEKQREIINQKEFQYKIDKNTSHIPDDVRKSLRVEAIFEAAKEYYDYIEQQIGLSEGIGDSLKVQFDNANVSITHMSLGQYFRRSLSKQAGVKEQQIMNQFQAFHDSSEQKGIMLKVSSHDNVLQAHMESEKTLCVKVPSMESPTNYEAIPVQLRNAVQDTMHKAFSVRGKIPFPSSCKVEVTDDARILMTVINEKILKMIEEHKDAAPEEYLIFTLTDVHIGSIANRNDYFIKYLDYARAQALKLAQKPNMKKVGRIALFNGDIIEGINYPTAMMRNAPTRLSIPQTQMGCTLEILKPFFFSEDGGRLSLDKDIEHIVLTHGNHEYNSGFIHSGMMATETLYQYFKAHMEQEYDAATVKKKLMYNLYTGIEKDKTLFTSIGAFSKLGLNVHMMHSYGRSPSPTSASSTQERWVTKIGGLAKPWDILIQGHYHKFSLGEVAGKVLLTFPSFTEVSDFEYERGLDSPMCGILLHLSSRYGLVVEILTREFLDSYKCQHPMFKDISVRKFYESCVQSALTPNDLSEFR